MPQEVSSAGCERTLIIACGALAKEILALIQLNGWDHLSLTCLPAIWHNTPDKIPEGVRQKIRASRDSYHKILVAYGDCGTGGLLDQVLIEEGVERIDGPHCYAFFYGLNPFLEMAEADPASFYLTDYLVRHFDRLIMEGMGLDRHPELLPIYFGNYTKLIYLAQINDESLQEKAEQAANKLGLSYEYQFTGYGELNDFLAGSTKTIPGNRAAT